MATKSNTLQTNQQLDYFSYFKLKIDKTPSSKSTTFTIKLYSHTHPITVSNFISLCTGTITPLKLPSSSTTFPPIEKATPPLSYKTSIIHRIIPNFLIHLGDITKNDGTGGKSIYGYKFDDENFQVKHDKKGLVGMANLGKDTNGSQFYITLKECNWLDGRYVIFGEVFSGMEFLEELAGKFGSESGLPRGRIEVEECGVLAGEQEVERFLNGGGEDGKQENEVVEEKRDFVGE